MAFDFDPGLILGAARLPSGPSLADVLQGISNRQTQANQQQLQQATLADMLRKQQNQQSLMDIARGTVGAYSDPVAKAYAQGGFGAEAADAQLAALKRQQVADLVDDHVRALLASKAATIKNEDDYNKWVANIAPDKRAKFGLPEKYDAAALQAVVQANMAPEEQAKYGEQVRRQGELANPDSTTSRIRATVAQQLGLPVTAGTPGNAIDDKELDLGEKAQAARERRLSMEALGRLRYGPGGAEDYTPEAIDALALQTIHSGHTPQFGPGATGAALRKRVLNRVAELAAGATPGTPSDASTPRAVPDLASAAVQFEADKHSMKEAQAQADAQDVKEDKALADINVLRGTMKGLVDTGSPLLNAVGRKFQEATGDPAYAAFRTAREAALPTINAVINSGQLSVGAREEIKDLLRKDDSLKSMDAALGIIQQDMARSREATHKRLSNTTARMSGKAAAPDTASPHTPEELAAARAWLANPKNGTPEQRAQVQKVLEGP